MKASHSPRPFSGRLTQDIRKQIQSKRTALGLTYYRLALFFNLDWTTIRKWERGPTLSCNATNRKRLQEFISGQYDHEFLFQPMSVYDRNQSGIPPQVKGCMEKIINTYIICQGNSIMKRKLQDNLEQTINETLRKLAQPTSEDY